MRILSFLCGALLLWSGTAAAQTPAPDKETLYVDLFSRIRTVPAPYAERLRELVLDGFVQRGRHHVVDAEAAPVAASAAGTGLTAPERAAEDMSARLETLAPQAAAAGIRYLVGGTITGYRFEHVDLPAEGKKAPRQGFRVTFNVVLSGLDLKLDERLADEPFTLTASAPAAADADLAALERIRGQLEYYIDRNFKFETLILDLCPADRKGRIRDLYIHSGTQMGVKRGDLFLVYEEDAVGGVTIRRKIGRLRVGDVENPDAARCRITQGDAAIVAAFRAHKPLICISDGKAFGF